MCTRVLVIMISFLGRGVLVNSLLLQHPLPFPVSSAAVSSLPLKSQQLQAQVKPFYWGDGAKCIVTCKHDIFFLFLDEVQFVGC